MGFGHEDGEQACSMAFLDDRLHNYTELGKVVRRNTLVAKYEWAFGGAFSDCRGVAILLGGSPAKINQISFSTSLYFPDHCTYNNSLKN